MNKEQVIEKAKQVWAEIKEHTDVFWVGASFGFILGAIL